MKAIVYKGPLQVAVEEVDNPRIESPTDAIVKITSAAICGSDLHMYEGRTSTQPGTVFGHEPMGVVEDVGGAVISLQKGDRVVMPFNISCGFCFNCTRGYWNSCLTANPNEAHAAYGYAGMGPFRGAQAEKLRVPFADVNALKLPGQPGDEWEDDFITLADIFPTGYHGTELARVRPGDTVAVFGAGPVGLMATYSALLRGAAEVFTVDGVPERLEKARQVGAIPINFKDGDPVQQIFDIRRQDDPVMQAMRPGEADKMPGVMCGVDAVGYQAKDDRDPSRELPTQVIDDLVRVVNQTGHIGIVGVYPSEDPRGIDQEARNGIYHLPLGEMFDKDITLGLGQCSVKRYNTYLRDLIISGRAKPGYVVSQHLALSDAPKAFQEFDKRAPGYTKVVLKPEQSTAA